MTKFARRAGQQGFSLVELMVTIVVMFIVFAVVFRSANMFQQRGQAETEKVDSVQAARDFMDTVNRDIHDAGFPPMQVNPSNQDPVANTVGPVANACVGAPTLACSCVGNPAIACGIIYYTPTKIQYEGDLDGTGTVYVVTLQITPGANGNCPCILQRGVVTKTQFLANVVPTYYTEVNGLLNSGNWAGAGTYAISLPGLGNYASYAPIDVFAGYYNDATRVTAQCTSPAACVGSATPIRELQVTANVAPTFSDMQLKTFPVFSITTKARLSNVSP